MTPQRNAEAPAHGEHEAALDAAVEHVLAVQERSRTRLAQIEHDVPTSTFGPVALVDVRYLVSYAVDAYLAAKAGQIARTVGLEAQEQEG